MEPRIHERLADMTVREKIGQTCQASFSDVYRRAVGDFAGYFSTYPIGSLLSLGGPYLLNDIPQADTLVNVYSSDGFVMAALNKTLFGKAPFLDKSRVNISGEWVSPEIYPLPKGVVQPADSDL